MLGVIPGAAFYLCHLSADSIIGKNENCNIGEKNDADGDMGGEKG